MSSLPPNDGQQPQPAARPASVQNQPGQRGQPEPAAAAPARNRQVDTGTNPPIDPLTNHPLRYTAGRQAETKRRGQDKDKPVNEQAPQAEEENRRLADEERQRQEDADRGNDTGVV